VLVKGEEYYSSSEYKIKRERRVTSKFFDKRIKGVTCGALIRER
jgi:hypothetical protein